LVKNATISTNRELLLNSPLSAAHYFSTSSLTNEPFFL
jgi:hypothetical protein